MKRTDPFQRYSVHAYRWATVRGLDRGFTAHELWHTDKGRAFVTQQCELYESAQKPLPGLEPASVRPDVSAPSSVPNEYTEASGNFWDTLASVGTFRGLHVVADGRGGYTATIKVTLPCGRRVYRYGRLSHPSGVEDMLHHTVANDRWTPDKI